MAVIGLNPVDPEIASALFKDHLDKLWEAAWVGRRGWQRRDLDPLHSVITMSAARASGESDTYFIRLGAEYYDLGPPVVNFVCEDGCATLNVHRIISRGVSFRELAGDFGSAWWQPP